MAPPPRSAAARRIVMLGASPRTQRSHSSVQLPPDFQSAQSTVPTFVYRTDDFVYDLREAKGERGERVNGDCNGDADDKRQNLQEVMRVRWEDAREGGAINYSLNCLYKFLDGRFNMSIQLNVERGELRRKPMRFKHIREPFNPLRWNFTKLHENEVLTYLRCEDCPISDDPLDRHLIAVNASPLERGHSLIVPAVNKCSPQVLTRTAVRLAVDCMLLVEDETFHILFNSLLGQASVNHLHMHGLYWPYDSDLINRRFDPLSDIPCAFTIRPPEWMLGTFAFQLQHGKEGYNTFIDHITTTVEFLTKREQAHNVFFTRAQPMRIDGSEWEEDRRGERGQLVTCYVFPRLNMTGAKPPTNFNPAANELAGCLTSYTVRFFESASEQSAVRIIEEEAALPDSQFMLLAYDLSDVLAGRPIGASRPEGYGDPVGLTSPELDELHDSFQTFEPPFPRRHSHSLRGETINMPALITDNGDKETRHRSATTGQLPTMKFTFVE